MDKQKAATRFDVNGVWLTALALMVLLGLAFQAVASLPVGE